MSDSDTFSKRSHYGVEGLKNRALQDNKIIGMMKLGENRSQRCCRLSQSVFASMKYEILKLVSHFSTSLSNYSNSSSSQLQTEEVTRSDGN